MATRKGLTGGASYGATGAQGQPGTVSGKPAQVIVMPLGATLSGQLRPDDVPARGRGERERLLSGCGQRAHPPQLPAPGGC